MFNGPTFSSLLTGWEGLASTSYGAKLTFNGDVRIYDWKDIDNVDSSTLIENFSGEFEELNFDVKEMISKLSNQPIVSYANGKQYVHGGIAFFGGGKNYSVFENNGKSFKGIEQIEGVEFSCYKITLADVEKSILEMAAGKEAFYFALYDGNSDFGPIAQEQIFQQAYAYDCIYFND